MYSDRAEVLAPTNLEELRQVFAAAREAGRRVTIRAGGHCFDGQAVGDDLVVSMLELDSIELLPEGRLKVGPGATWGAILAELEPRGLVPGVTVTTEHATAGGTLSGDCLSRFSPSYGKEGEWIESFDLLTTEGELLQCTPPLRGSDPEGWSLEQRAYCGVIGGLGYLGAVVSITYRVLPVGAGEGGQIGVRTIVRKFTTFADLAADLVPTARQMQTQSSDPTDPEKLDAIWSAVDTRGKGTETALFFTSTYTTTKERRRMPLHRPRILFRLLIEWLMRVPFFSKLLWRIYYSLMFKDGEEYVDDLEGYAFFMDGNARAKRIGKRLGFKMRNAQQTFVVPSNPGADGGWDRAQDDLVEWLEFAHGFLTERDLTPTLNDVLFLPEDLPFLLSASAELPGFVVSYAFETSSQRRLARVETAFSELADVLWEKFHGRVYLVKNVFARRETLAKMYGDHAVEFVRLKQELDPRGLLRNDFLERTFGDLLAEFPAGAAGYPPR
ncbi:MAG TPA: FAD-binding oxidoreductase [Solirubrobacterales bacterium]|nr:FAD-binding oxidoreductase [Solirubrobacterales bacterium]